MSKRRPGVESCINKCEHFGLDRVQAHGADGFEKMVGLPIVAANIHRIGHLLYLRFAKRKWLKRVA